MSRASILADKAFEWFLSDVSQWLPEAAEEALRAGASVLAAKMKRNLRGEISDKQANHLVGAFGITPVGQDKARNWNVHLGFDGYQQPGTGAWKSTGIPFQLIARVFESGSVKDGYQWRKATHFARRAVQAKRHQAEAAMKTAADRVIAEAVKETKGA